MDTEWIFKLISFTILIFLSGFFSGSEVAYFSLDKKKVEKYFGNNVLLIRYANNLLSFPRRLLVTILIGNTLVNVGLSIIAVLLTYDIASTFRLNLNLAIAFQIIITTILVLLFGELLPKMIATKHQVGFAKFVTIPLYIFSTVIYPLSEFITELIKLSISKVKFDKSKSALSKDELSELATLSTEKGAIDENEKEIINSIVEFRDTSVSDVMTPRVDIVALSEDKTVEDAINLINESGHSRIPVYRSSIDSISGVVHAKNLLEFIYTESGKKQTKLKNLLKKVLFVPESKKIGELLQEFQAKKNHLAIVVDEYGGTAGLITLEDIIEEVVGDIWDEYDEEESDIQIITTDKYLVKGNVLLNDLQRVVGINMFNENNPDIETLAAFILNHYGEIPSEGDSFLFNDYKFTVKTLHRKRILKVLIEKVNKES